MFKGFVYVNLHWIPEMWAEGEEVFECEVVDSTRVQNLLWRDLQQRMEKRKQFTKGVGEGWQRRHVMQNVDICEGCLSALH